MDSNRNLEHVSDSVNFVAFVTNNTENSYDTHKVDFSAEKVDGASGKESIQRSEDKMEQAPSQLKEQDNTTVKKNIYKEIQVQSISEQEKSEGSTKQKGSSHEMESSEQGQKTNEIQSSQQQKGKEKLSINDFMYQGSLGKGAYAEVMLMKKSSSGKVYAMKVIDKQFLLREKKDYQVMIEREILIRLNCDYLVKLHYTFQDKFKLYFVMEYCKGGEFSRFLRKHQALSPEALRFYLSEVTLIIAFLHSQGIVHRDLKPENLMLTEHMHLKVIDFGTALFMNNTLVSNEFLMKLNKMKNEEASEEEMIHMYQKKHKSTFVGTAEYVSPELLNDEECGYGADIWALGCIMFKMMTGKTPFWDQTEYLVFQNIKQGKYSLQGLKLKQQEEDLLKGLLEVDQSKRLTISQVQRHPYFHGVDWNNIYCQKPPKVTPLSATHLDTTGLLLRGTVLKKCGWIFYKPRLLVLKNNFSLEYFDPTDNSQKGTIRIIKDVKAGIEGESKWWLQIPGRRYHFKFYEQPCALWVDTINRLVKSI